MHKFETSFAFPLIKINTLITYTEVEKPSGISYFLLVLINEYTDKKVKISTLLKQFGVPSDLHELFADEIDKLLKLGIIKSDYDYVKGYFEEYQLNVFGFTPKGKKVFMDEAIPSNINKDIKQDLFYNPATNQLTLMVDRDYGNIDSSALGEIFIKQFSEPDSVIIEEFLNSKKSNGLPIKKEEVILSSKLLKREYNFITYPVTLAIEDNDQITFQFEDSKLKSFFEKYYTKEMIQNLILVQNKFKFTDGKIIQTKLTEQYPYEHVYLPEAIKQKQNEKSTIDVHTPQYPTMNAKLIYPSSRILSRLNATYSFLKIIDLNRAYGYIPANLTLTSPIFGPIQLKLLIEQKVEKAQLGSLFSDLLMQYDEFQDDTEEFSYKSLLLLCKLTSALPLIHPKIDAWLKDLSIDEQVIMLGKIKDKSINEPIVYEYIKQKGLSLIEAYMKDLQIENLETKLSNLSWIIKANKRSDIQVLEQVFRHLENKRIDKVKLYSQLESLGYDNQDVLTFMKEDIYSILSDKKTSNKLSKHKLTLDNALKNLQTLAGIQDPFDYAVKDNVNKTDFINTYKVYREALNELLIVDKFDKEVLKSYKAFDVLFEKLNDLFVIEKNAIGNPKAINEKMIDSKINSGDVLSVVTNLYVKLSYICKNQFNMDGDLINMIQTLEKNDYIDKNDGLILHQFRQYRNDLEHANEIKKSLEKKDLQEVKRIVFKLEGMKI